MTIGEYGDLFEGDIYVGNVGTSDSSLTEKGSTFSSRNLPEQASRFWKDDLSAHNQAFRIRVFIEKNEYSDYQIKKIRKSIRNLAKRSKVLRIHFIRDAPDDGTPFIRIFKGTQCASYVGQVSQASSLAGQPLSLGDECLEKGIIQHEMMHALGFFHEHSRSDRDRYIMVRFDNIMEGKEESFTSISPDSNFLGTKYDLESVMHFALDAFSKNGFPTIMQQTRQAADVGQRRKASKGDIVKIRLAYQCLEGIRSKLDYKSRRCTPNCPCGVNMNGCGINDKTCRSDLTCINNKCKKRAVTFPVEETMHIADDTGFLPPDVETTTHHADDTGFLPPDADVDTVNIFDENGGTEYYHPDVDNVAHDEGFLPPPGGLKYGN